MKTASELVIRPSRSGTEARACAQIMAASEPWMTLGRNYHACLGILSNERRERYFARRGKALAGFLVLDMKGAFVGYIQTVCVPPEFRNRGIGTRLVRFAEERIFRDSPNVFLCVSSFNTGARRLYERLGYRVVGELCDYVISDQSELLLRKSLGPINSYRPAESHPVSRGRMHEVGRGHENRNGSSGRV